MPHLIFAKVLIAENKKVRDLPKYGEKLHGKRGMFIYYILENE